MKILFACGGTAGHINPALSVADSLCARYPGTEVLFAGNPKGMEARLIPKAGYPFAPIEVAGIQRKLTLENIGRNFSALCLLAFKPLAKKLRKAPTATNGDRNLGREATVLTPVTAEATGRVRLDGVDWNARCATPGDTLAPGESCRVTEIHSTLLIVEPIRTETTH